MSQVKNLSYFGRNRRKAFNSFQPHPAGGATANPVTKFNPRVPTLPSGFRLGFIVVFMTVCGKVLRGRMHITLTGPGQHTNY